MRCILLLLNLCFVISGSKAQIKKFEMAEPATFVKADFMGSIYAISNGFSIYKYSAEGNRMGNYSFHKYGAVTVLDVSNPMQVVAFYKDAAKLVFLDMNMEKLNEINLGNFPNVKVKTIAAAEDKSGVYFIDENDGSLKKINARGDIIELNNDLPLQNTERIFTYEKNICAVGQGKVLLMDAFGQVIEAYASLDVNVQDVYNGKLSGIKEGKPFMLDFIAGKVEPVTLPVVDFPISLFFVSGKNVYIVRDKKLHIY